jgi:hypothetical protein
MRPALRKLFLATHVALAVGWLGAVVTFLMLSLVAFMSHGPADVRSSYIAMNLVGLYVIIPLAVATLTTGLIEAFTTPWGLLRHYWVIAKLILVVMATTLLLLHQYSAVAVAAQRAVAAAGDAVPDIGALGKQLVLDASLASMALLAAVALAVYKPRGLTPYGRERLQAQGGATGPLGSRVGLTVLLALLAAILLVGALAHLTGLHRG